MALFEDIDKETITIGHPLTLPFLAVALYSKTERMPKMLATKYFEHMT